MRYSHITLVCVLAILLNSCSKILFINGMYSGKGNPHVFVFSEDSTFKYEYHGVWYSESSGTWQKKRNTIFINSFEQRDKMPIEYQKTKNDKKKAIINVKINISDKPESDYICFPYINGKSMFEDPEKGSYSFDTKGPVDSICFLIAKRPFILRGTGYKMGYDDVKTKTIYPHMSAGENLDVLVDIVDYLFGYKVFKDEKLELKNGKIIFKERGKKNKLYLKK